MCGIGVSVEHAGERCREVARYHECSIVCARAYAVERGLLFMHERPSELVVFGKAVAHHGACVDVPHAGYLCAFVLYDHGDRHGRGVGVGIPVGEDVNPGIERRNDADAYGDDDGDGAAHDAADVASEDAECGAHGRPLGNEGLRLAGRRAARCETYTAPAPRPAQSSCAHSTQLWNNHHMWNKICG